MGTYIAMLRGVNVGGNPLKMERLRALWAELAFEQVRTYVQSGNVVFIARSAPAKWLAKIEEKLAGETRLPVSVVVRSSTELGRAIAANPFLNEKNVDRTRLHVTFLNAVPPKKLFAQLTAIDSGADQLRGSGKEVYLYCPDGYGKTKLNNTRIEKLLGVTATTRNWNTVTTLHAMAAAGC